MRFSPNAAVPLLLPWYQSRTKRKLVVQGLCKARQTSQVCVMTDGHELRPLFSLFTSLLILLGNYRLAV